MYGNTVVYLEKRPPEWQKIFTTLMTVAKANLIAYNNDVCDLPDDLFFEILYYYFNRGINNNTSIRFMKKCSPEREVPNRIMMNARAVSEVTNNRDLYTKEYLTLLEKSGSAAIIRM